MCLTTAYFSIADKVDSIVKGQKEWQKRAERMAIL